MAIEVVTGGPTSAADPTLSTSVPTFSTMAEAIADDISDETSEYAAQIKAAITSSIRYCERYVFYFNETRDITFPTVAGREWYDATDNTNIPTIAGIVEAFTEENGRRSILNRETPENLELLSDNSASRGEPYAYAYFGQRIRLYPIPDVTVYTIRLQVGPYRLAPLTSVYLTNAWFSEAYDMVKARAKYILAKDTLRDADVAAEALNDFNDQFSALKNETSRRSGRGVIVGTCF